MFIYVHIQNNLKKIAKIILSFSTYINPTNYIVYTLILLAILLFNQFCIIYYDLLHII